MNDILYLYQTSLKLTGDYMGLRSMHTLHILERVLIDSFKNTPNAYGFLMGNVIIRQSITVVCFSTVIKMTKCFIKMGFSLQEPSHKTN